MIDEIRKEDEMEDHTHDDETPYASWEAVPGGPTDTDDEMQNAVQRLADSLAEVDEAEYECNCLCDVHCPDPEEDES